MTSTDDLEKAVGKIRHQITQTEQMVHGHRNLSMVKEASARRIISLERGDQ